MKHLTFIALTLCSAATLSFGANWNAKLLDANCASSNSQKTSSQKLEKACAPTSATTSFAIQANGKTYTLDEKGNEMTAAAMKNGNIKPDNDGDVHVTVNGTAQGNTIKVDSVNGGKGHD
jgi:hypothetical protein